ncbi:MAG TPA: response regulator, partial [Burkholderiales bacterium]|nr:response regulator [Burkholderiales bacterium]
MLASATPVFHDEEVSATGSVRILPLHRILLIDRKDESDLKNLLVDTGWDVETAVDGLSFSGEPPQIVVADLDMPRQDAIAFCVQMREKAPDSFFIGLAQPGEIPELSRSVESSVDDFLIKPIDANTFMMHLRNASR